MFQSQWLNLFAIFVNKVINMYTTFHYTIYNINQYNVLNGTCQLRNSHKFIDVDHSSIMTIVRFGYTLSALGGILASKWLGFRTTLTVGGAIMSLAMGLMAMSVQFSLICQQSLYVFVWLLHPVYMGFVIPCLFYGFVRWTKTPWNRLTLVVLYYYSAESTPWIQEVIAPFIFDHIFERSFEYACGIAFYLSLIFTALSALQKHDDLQSSFESPTKNRLIRYFRILTVFTLYAVRLYDGHKVNGQQEVLLFFNSTDFGPTELALLRVMKTVNIVRWLNMAGILSTAVTLAAIGIFGRRRRFKLLSPETRIQIGIVISGLVALASFVAALVFKNSAAPSLALTTTIFCFFSFLDGIGEVITMVAVYEFLMMFSGRNHKLLVVGISLSIWSLASIVRMAINGLIFDVLMPNAALSTKLYVPHGIGFVLLAVCLAYSRFVSFPLAYTLINEQEASGSEVPLLYINQPENEQQIEYDY